MHRYRNIVLKVIVVGLPLVFASTGSAAPAAGEKKGSSAQFKCWTNKDGLKECGNAVPPEYSQQEHTAYSAQGLTVKHSGRAKSAEEFAEEQRQLDLKKEADRKRQEIEKTDKVLLATFSSEDDLLLARDGKLASVEGQIQLTESLNKKLQANLDQLVSHAADAERSGQKPSVKLTENIENVGHQIQKNNAFIESKRQEQEAIRQKFDTDLNRLRELRAAR
jgi:hypothetical protein